MNPSRSRVLLKSKHHAGEYFSNSYISHSTQFHCLTTLDIPILRFLPKLINNDKSQEKQVCWFQKLCNEEGDQTILADLKI